ncbi:hypothetical protein F5Y03DRAFT_393325 [Xylaria venustula]|nr:hypothetical protein F5Y03DRAFT_393325 [Xylaria venustula]
MLYPLRLNQYGKTLQRPWEESPKDWDRKMTSTPGKWRVSRKSYYEELVLLPFGHDRNADWGKPLQSRRPGPENTGNWVENPFYFGTLLFDAPMASFSDPLEGWSVEDVAKNELAPKNDIVSLKSIDIDMEVHHCDANILRTELAGQQFSRIHTSSLADDYYMKMKPMLESLSPLLKPKSISPFARLISLRREDSNVNRRVLEALSLQYMMATSIIGPDHYGLETPGLFAVLSTNYFYSQPEGEQKEVVREWKGQRVRALNRVGAPLGAEVAENVLTTSWPFRRNNLVVTEALHDTKPPFMTANGACRYFEWQRKA